ncbi:MAG: AraC family transcriptional regulator [Bacteroidota bacterium]
MDHLKTNPIYTYHPELIELHKGNQKCEVITNSNSILPIQKVYQIKSAEATPEKTVILPDVNCYVVYTKLLTGEVQLFLVGPRTKAIEINRSERVETIIAKLSPSRIGLHKNLAIRQLVNTTYSIRSLLGNRAEKQLVKKITDRRCQKKETPETNGFTFTSSYSRKNLDDHIKPYLEKNQIPTVNELARHLGISERYLRDLSYEQYGIPPKTVLKIKRLHRSLSTTAANRNYSQIALASGYYDQSHMISEYQFFIGKTPKQLFG